MKKLKVNTKCSFSYRFIFREDRGVLNCIMRSAAAIYVQNKYHRYLYQKSFLFVLLKRTRQLVSLVI